MTDWIDELIDLGIGDLAQSTLRKMMMGQPVRIVCRYCGTKVKKYAVSCPKCRRGLN